MKGKLIYLLDVSQIEKKTCPLKIDLGGGFKHCLCSTLPGEMIQWFLFRGHVSFRKCNVGEPKEMFLSIFIQLCGC